MAVQVSYPGVYIEEFTPGAPIEGVGTSTAGFIGTAESGPIDEPMLIQSWDAFKATFGDFIAAPATGYLGPAVYGFFLNGGTTCYVLRRGTGIKAFANLPGRQSGTNPPAALIATALQEGTVGNSFTVKIDDSSVLADMLGTAGPSLKLQRAETAVSALATDGLTLTVADNTGFAPGDSILLTDGNNQTANAVVADLGGNNTTLIVREKLVGLDFTQGTRSARTADLAAGRRVFRVSTPATLTLGTAFPLGATVQISGRDSANAAIQEICTVEFAGGDQITVAAPLKHTFSLADSANVPTLSTLEFDLQITDTSTGTSETFKRLAMDTRHPNYWRNAVESRLIRLTLPTSPNPADDPRPKSQTQVYALQSGTPDNPQAAWSEIQNNPNKYLDLFKPVDEISIVSIPGATDKGTQQALITHCESTADRFAILDSKSDATVQTISTQLGDVISTKGYAALYFPWILAHNPLRNADEFWPPSGHVAGIFARSDNQRGVHKAPANEPIRGALGLQLRLTDNEQGPLNLKGINVLRLFAGEGQPIVWGARTTANDRNWQYVNIRRLFLFLEESIQEGIRWAVFEPNNQQLWQKLKRTITEFLTRVWRDGALFGGTAEEAFYVRIDEALNPVSTQRLGRLYIEIGVRPAYPAEFIVVRIGIWEGGSEIAES
jgi:phage tail sheath protein FI